MNGRNNMTEKELVQFLKDNLTIEVSHPEYGTGYMDIDEHNITVEIKLCGKSICKDRSWS